MNSADYTDLIGIPFANRGRDVKSGLDCYGLVREVYRKNGIELPEYNADYDDKEKINELMDFATHSKSVWRKVEGNNIPVPCVIAMRFNVPKGYVNHAAVYIGAGKFLHIRENAGSCIEKINSPMWKMLIEGFYEYIGDRNGKASNN